MTRPSPTTSPAKTSNFPIPRRRISRSKKTLPTTESAARSPSTASKSPSSRSASNTWVATARSSPKACATTPARTSEPATLRWIPSSRHGGTPTRSAPSSRNWRATASSSPPCRMKSAPPSIPSISSATSHSSRNR